MSGWVCSYRQIWASPLFKGDGMRVAVWHWLLHHAAWEDMKFRVGGDIIELARGQVCASLRQIEEATGMGRKALSGFLSALEREGAIVKKTHRDARQGRTIITICNYSRYQDQEQVAAPASAPSTRQARATKEQDKPLNNIPTTSDAASASPSDPVKVMFDSGVKMLMAAGKSSSSARSILGKWRSEHGVEAVIAALGRAQREGAIDPVSYIEGCLRFSEKNKKPYKTDAQGRPQIGSVMVNRKGETIRYVNHYEGWSREIV